jgi:hypothetical protein
MYMPDEPEDRLSRADIHAVENRIFSLKVKIASLPTQRDLTRVAFWALLAGAVIVLSAVFGSERFSVNASPNYCRSPVADPL